MLVVKLPKGKPPFIGILFDDKFKAEDSNSDLINNHKDKTFRIIFEFIRDHVNVRLVCDDALIIISYTHQLYDMEKLKNWFYLTRDCKHYNFSQIYEEGGSWKVAKTFKTHKLFVLKVEKYQVFTSEYKSSVNGVTGKWAEW